MRDAAEPVSTRGESSDAKAHCVKAKYKILIIDDSAEDQSIYRDYICRSEECEYEFESASTAAEGLNLFATRIFDCILLDYQLPDMDGIKVLDRWREQNKLESPVVMITGRGDEKLAVRALKIGAADYIVKSSVTPENLFRAVHNAIEKHRAARQLEHERQRFIAEQKARLEIQAREIALVNDLRKERERYESFIEQVPAPVIVLRGHNQTIEYVNRPMKRMLGQSEKAISLNSLRDVFGEEIAELAKLVYVSQRSYQANEFEIDTLCSASGVPKQRYFHLLMEPHRSSDERVTGVIAIMNDVTSIVEARQRAEESERRAKESEDRFRRIAEIIPHMIWVADARGDGEYFNSAFLNYTGTKLEQNRGRGWLSSIHPADIELVEKRWSECTRSGLSFEATYRMRRASDGEYRWHVSRGMALMDSDGHVFKWYGSNADVHDQRVLSENLRDSEQRLISATQSSKVGIWEIDLETRKTWRNLEFDKVFGFTNPTPDWSIQNFLERVLVEDRAKVEHAIYNAMETHVPFAIEFKVLWVNETLHWLSMRGGVDRAANGRPRMAGTLIDVTDRNQREQDLSDARNAAVAANATKTAFLANMSHEIRTPLGAIMGFTDLIANESLSREERAEFAETVQRNGRALMQIIDDILDLSKIEAGKFELVSENVKIASILKDLSSLYSKLAFEKKIALTFDVAEDVPETVKTDGNRLRQILFNAISNAIKFTERGSVVIAVRMIRPTAAGAQWICFAVRDSGIGISEEQQAKLFQPFTQADSTMTRKYGGTGLGLMLSRRLAKLLGGAYYLARSAPGQGSTFELRVPVGAAEIQDSAKAKAKIQPLKPSANPGLEAGLRLAGLRVLLVDDSTDSRLLTKRYLEREGAQVEHFGSAAEALTKFGEANYDVTITDIQMPIMDGFSFTRELRKRMFTKPVIGLTAHVFKEDRERVLAEGLDDHLGKPLSAEALVGSLRKHVPSAPQ